MGAAEWAGIAALVVPALLGALGLIAEKTSNTTDDKIVAIIRKIWSWVPIGQRDPAKMGKNK